MAQLTTAEYAKYLGVGASMVRKMIHEGKTLPGVLGRSYFGKAHVFSVSQAWIDRRKKSLKKVA
jgi:excisionase family DNA binding protein